MKMKLILGVFIAFFTLGITVYCHADGESREVDGLYITKPKVIILNPPITVTNKMTLNDIKPTDRLPFVELETSYYRCNTWDEVLALYTPSSAKQLNKPERKKHFEDYINNKNNRELGFSFILYITYEQNGDAIIITQSVPWELKDDNYNSYSFFKIDGYRKVDNQWKVDWVLPNLKLDAIIASTPPIKLQEKIDEWWESLENEAKR
jgi:hypothetical protein